MILSRQTNFFFYFKTSLFVHNGMSLSSFILLHFLHSSLWNVLLFEASLQPFKRKERKMLKQVFVLKYLFESLSTLFKSVCVISFFIPLLLFLLILFKNLFCLPNSDSMFLFTNNFNRKSFVLKFDLRWVVQIIEKDSDHHFFMMGKKNNIHCYLELFRE